MPTYRYEIPGPMFADPDEYDRVIELFRERGLPILAVEWEDVSPQQLAEIVHEVSTELRSRGHATIDTTKIVEVTS